MSRFFHKTRRPVSAALLLCFLGTLVAPIVEAQDFDVYTGERRSAEYRPDPRDDYEFAGDIASRVALKDDLEKRWAEATVRSDRARRRIDQLRGARPPSGADATEWYQRRDAEIGQLEQFLYANDRAVTQYRSSLGGVYSSLQRDRDQLGKVRDEGLRNDLGSLIGVGGMAAAPVWARPTVGDVTGALSQSLRTRQLASVTNRIASSQARSALLADKLATATPPTRNSWTVVETNGRVVLQGQNGQVKDLGSATTKSGDGSSIRNDAAFRKGQYYGELYSARSNIQHQIDSLRHTRSQASNAKAKAGIDQQITKLESRQAQLQKDIAEYDSTRKPAGSTMKNLAASAAKWAAFSVGITVATNVITQMTRNGWDPARIDWGAAIEPLRTAEFWGGTAGSFGVSMLLSAVVPGGAFVKTLAAIGGAAIGWQLGTGNLFQTDWMQLGTTTVGATVGSLLGAAIGGPIGAFLGGIAGHFVANWLLGKIREWLEAKSEPYGASDRRAYPEASPPYGEGFQRPAFQAPPAIDPQAYSSPADLKARMDQAYLQMQESSRDPSQLTQFDKSRREYMMLKSQLEQMRQSGQY